jgi:lambda family phage portal protein
MASKSQKSRSSSSTAGAPAGNVHSQLKEAKAQLELLQVRALTRQVKAAVRTQKTSLAIHAAADRGRKNKDWQASNGSADLAIIPDANIINARARQLVRDSWPAKSIARAYARNICGKGITVIPHAKDKDGKPLSKLNRKAQAEWQRWSKSKSCDVEGKKTFGQVTRLAVEERATVGEHFIGWSYQMPQTPDGRFDPSQPVGFKIQGFEPEQLDQRLYDFLGNEVRGGVEVDSNGAAVAYHLYTRNPNDYLFRRAFWSKRIPVAKLWHYYKQERVLQTRGISPMTPVMQDIRDFQRYQSYTLWKVVMEACIGLIFTKLSPTLPGARPGFPAQQGDNGQTPSGATTVDFIPGMSVEAAPGEDVKPFNTGSPGQQYGPFAEVTLRGIGAGAGMSYGQIARKSDGNYSSARQDMLEDRREWEPEQELLTDDIVSPAYHKWFHFAALEGRFDDVDEFKMDEFLAESWRFTEAEYIPPAQIWIDPQKEAEAFAILLKNRLITREEIIALRGGRSWSVIEKIAEELTVFDDLSLSLPENDDERKSLRDVLKQYVANRLGVIDNMAANAIDIEKLVPLAGMPARKYTQPTLDLNVPPPPATPGALPGAAPVNGAAPNGKPTNDKPVNGNGKAAPLAAGTNGLRRLALGILNAPNYQACNDEVQSCETCSYLVGNTCQEYLFDVNPGYVCDSWLAVPVGESPVRATSRTLPPSIQDGERGIDRDFQPAADTSPLP